MIQDTASMCSRVHSPQLISIPAYEHGAVEGEGLGGEWMDL